MTMMNSLLQEMNGSISYLEEGLAVELKKQMYVTDDARLAFEKHAVGVARMYFTNHDGLAVPIPAGVRVVKDGRHSDVPPINGSFLLSWDHNYVVFVGNDVFYKLRKQKQHCISGPESEAAKKMLVGGTAAAASHEAAQLAAMSMQAEEDQGESEDGEDQ
jgi:hypothetical protein